MPRIKIGYGLREFTDRDSFHVKGETPLECLDNLICQVPKIRTWIYDENGMLNVILFINGKIVYNEELERKLDECDEMAVLQLIDGG